MNRNDVVRNLFLLSIFPAAQWSIGPSGGEKIPKIIFRFSEISFAFFRL